MAKYLFILTVVLGVAMFMYKDKPVSASQEVDSGIGIGEILLVSNFNKCLKNSNKLRINSLTTTLDSVSNYGRAYGCDPRTNENRLPI